MSSLTGEEIVEIAKQSGASVFKNGTQVVVGDYNCSGAATLFVQEFAKNLETKLKEKLVASNTVVVYDLV